MRLFTKIFFCAVAMVTVAMSITGAFLISKSFSDAVETEMQRALDEYSLLRFTFQVGIMNAVGERKDIELKNLQALCRQTAMLAQQGAYIAIFDGAGDDVYCDFPDDYSFEGLLDATENRSYRYRIENISGEHRVVVAGAFTQNEVKAQLVASRSIQQVFDNRDEMCANFLRVYGFVITATLIVMLFLSFMITLPINRLIKSTKRISDGSYSERVDIKTGGEIGMLSDSFNLMAQQIQDKITELEENARRREEFTMNFAHELKTPLTSIIGYADMICNKELTKSETNTAAEFILSEGMRLEALSLKMMELIVLGKHDFTLIETKFSDCIADTRDTIAPVAEKHGTLLEIRVQDAYVRVEPDLIKTLLMNIIDNSFKAGAKNIKVAGIEKEGAYHVKISDDGCGIEEKELERISEAFYMVDKSRSRKQHGAGLGLAICDKIADVHGTKLSFESWLNVGTTVSFTLPLSNTEGE